MAFWNKDPEPPTVSIGGTKVEVKPLGLEETLQLVLLLSPHIAAIERRWPEMQRAMRNTDGDRPQLLRTAFLALREEIAEMPGDMFHAFSILLGKTPDWMVEHNASASDLLAAIETLDEVNDFGALWDSIGAMGITLQYA